MKKYVLFAIFGLLLCAGCYRIPKDGDVSVVPTTNNPSMTRQGGAWMPGVEY